MTVLALDVETRLLASGVERAHAQELAGAPAWERPDLFLFACGVTVDVDTDQAVRCGPEDAAAMLAALAEADVTVGYNSLAFDLGVLGAYGDLGTIRATHIDLCAEVREALDALDEAQAPEVDRLRSGGLDALARANGLTGKTGAGEDAVALFREGRMDELLAYCEADARLTADLYRLARDRGELRVEAYYRNSRDERCYLPEPVFVPLAL